jgi:hypothetical protein
MGLHGLEQGYLYLYLYGKWFTVIILIRAWVIFFYEYNFSSCLTSFISCVLGLVVFFLVVFVFSVVPICFVFIVVGCSLLLCIVFVSCLNVFLRCVMCVTCRLCPIDVLLPPGYNPIAVK